MRIYRIALTGAQGTGKSTLARALVTQFAAARIPNVIGYKGVGDAAAEAGSCTGMQADVASIRHFVQLHQTRELTAHGDVQIFDRCLLDTLAYAQVLDCLSGEEFKSLIRYTRRSCEDVAKILWLRITSDYPVLNEQDESPEFRRAIDSAIGDLARSHAIPLIEHSIPPNSLEQIVKDVVGHFILAERHRNAQPGSVATSGFYPAHGELTTMT